MKHTPKNPWHALKDLRTAWRNGSRAGLLNFLRELHGLRQTMTFKDFIAMAESELGWTHSVTCRWMRIAEWCMSINEELRDLLPIEVGHLDELQRIPANRAVAFAKMFDKVFSDDCVSRPELSRLVDEFLDLKRERRQLDFFDRLRFPDLDKIRTAAVEGDLHIDAGRAGDYGVTMLTLAVHKCDQMDAEKKSSLTSAIATVLSEICGNDTAKILDAIHQAAQ